MRIMISGGSGFVGSALIRFLLHETNHDIINIDKVSPDEDSWLFTLGNNTRYYFENQDISSNKVKLLFGKYKPHYFFHLASDVDSDRAVFMPRHYLQNNIYGTYILLEAAREYMFEHNPSFFKFIQVSTNEVYGKSRGVYRETSTYKPQSVMAATKAAADMLAYAWSCTYGVPVITTRASCNYGPYQKAVSGFIPMVIERAINSETITLDCNRNIPHDWIHVDDHVRGIWFAADRGKAGETYNLGGNEWWCLEQITKMICGILDKMIPRRGGHESLIQYSMDVVKEEFATSVDIKKAYNELAWTPNIKFIMGLRGAVEWYIIKTYSANGMKYLKKGT